MWANSNKLLYAHSFTFILKTDSWSSKRKQWSSRSLKRELQQAQAIEASHYHFTLVIRFVFCLSLVKAFLPSRIFRPMLVLKPKTLAKLSKRLRPKSPPEILSNWARTQAKNGHRDNMLVSYPNYENWRLRALWMSDSASVLDIWTVVWDVNCLLQILYI